MWQCGSQLQWCLRVPRLGYLATQRRPAPGRSLGRARHFVGVSRPNSLCWSPESCCELGTHARSNHRRRLRPWLDGRRCLLSVGLRVMVERSPGTAAPGSEVVSSAPTPGLYPLIDSPASPSLWWGNWPSCQKERFRGPLLTTLRSNPPGDCDRALPLVELTQLVPPCRHHPNLRRDRGRRRTHAVRWLEIPSEVG